MQVAIGADHRGYALKELIKSRDYYGLPEIEWIDVGATELNPEDDYPDIAVALVEKMRLTPTIRHGILVCGSGVGMCVTANKFDRVRCGLAINPDQVRRGRAEDNINVLSLAADYLNIESIPVLIEVFLQTEYTKLPRYTRRIEKIMQIEAVQQKPAVVPS